MKKFLLLIFIVSLNAAFSQDIRIKNNPYENADELTKSKKSFNRERWFYEQRMYPNNFIPKDAYQKAYEQKENLLRENGYAMMSPFDTWTTLGPTTAFYFSYSNITSRMATVKYDPNNGNTIYIGAAFGGVWKSTDGGATWTANSDNEVSLSSGSIAIDQANSNIIYYGTGEATYSTVSYYGRGLLKSTNAGNSWTNYNSDLPSASYTARIVIRPNNSNQLLAAMGIGGLYRSTNGGINWSLIVSGKCDDVVFSPSGDTAYIVGSGTGYKISTNGGSSFNANATLTMGSRNHIAVCKSSPNVMYCSIYSSPNITVYKSTNAGSTFTQIVAGQNFSGSQAWYDFYMHVSPFDPNYAYVGSIDVWRTTDGGSTNFTNITNGYGGGNVHVDQHNIDFHPTDANQMLCVNDGGIWKSTNKGTSWTNLNTNQTLTQFYRIASDPSNANHILGGTQDNGTQRTTGPINWSAAFGGDGGEVCFHVKNNLYVLGETQNNGMYRSTNGGAGWSSSASGLSGSASWVSPIISHPDSNTIFYTARQQVFKSTNWGASWFAISSGTVGTIREMAISKSSSNIMYATSGDSIFKSTNRGYTFSDKSAGLPFRTITSVNIHPDSSQVAVITFSGFGAGKIYKTTNGGTSWTNISGNLPDSPANDAFIYYPGMSTGSYYIATDIGVFVTNNYGASWLELANGLPNTVAMHLDYHQTTNKLRIGTHGRGVWEIQLSSFAIDVQSLSLGVTGTQLFSSATTFPAGTVKNNAPSSATFNVTRKINPGGYSSTKTISNLGAGASADVTFDSWTFIPGTNYSIKDSVFIAGDLNTGNDTLSGNITPFIGQSIVKLCEGFYDATFPPINWNIEYSGTNYWTRNSVSSYGIGNGSAKFDFYNAVSGIIQSLVTPVFTASAAGDSLKFDNAYSPYPDPAYTDSLIIETSTNSGTNYSALVRLSGNVNGGSLNTTGASGTDYTPNTNQWVTKKYALPAGTNKIKFRASSGYGNNLFLDSIKIVTDIKFTLFNINIIPEGFYNTGSGILNMKDTIRAYLRNTFSPYTIIDSAISVIDTVNYNANFTFTKVISGTYYLMMKHRNTIETWSKSGGEILTQGITMNYDFTSASSQAFGNNEILRGTKYCIYSGDADQDGNIDLSDLSLIDNDAFNFSYGYLQTDLTGDNNIDLSDAAIADNNAFNFVSKITP